MSDGQVEVVSALSGAPGGLEYAVKNVLNVPYVATWYALVFFCWESV